MIFERERLKGGDRRRKNKKRPRQPKVRRKAGEARKSGMVGGARPYCKVSPFRSLMVETESGALASMEKKVRIRAKEILENRPRRLLIRIEGDGTEKVTCSGRARQKILELYRGVR